MALRASAMISVAGAMAVVVLLALVVAPGPRRSTRESSGNWHVSGVSHGMRLTLTIPRQVYHRNALIMASVRVRNVSGRTITSPGTSCTQTNPEVQSLSRSGRVLYPEGVAWLNFIPDCGATTEDSFMGSSYNATYRVLTVVRGPYLRAWMNIRKAPPDTSTVTALSPAVHLHLLPANPPKYKLGMVRGGLGLTLTQPPSAHGYVHYLSLSHCYPGNAPYDYLGVYWTFGTRHLAADCAHPTQWRLIAGWIGQSAVILDLHKG